MFKAGAAKLLNRVEGEMKAAAQEQGSWKLWMVTGSEHNFCTTCVFHGVLPKLQGVTEECASKLDAS